jgi:uncharacterized membrane protein YozB (DUF420 family)
MSATLAQTINLSLQLVILCLILIAYAFFRRKQYRKHAQTLTAVYFMIVLSFLLVMVLSLFQTYQTFTEPTTLAFDVASMAHIPFGIAGLALGGWLIGRWAYNDFSLKEIKAPRLMRATFSMWIITIVLGIVVFYSMPS